MLGAVAVSAAACATVLLSAPSAVANAPCGALTRPAPVSEYDIPPLDQLACADLRGIDFGQEQLSGADLHGSNLQGVSLVQADLTNANLAGADLAGATLSQAELIGANLRGANLRGARISQADLTDADLRDADLTNAELIQATLYGTDTRGADLTGAVLIQAKTGAPMPTEALPTFEPPETVEIGPAEDRVDEVVADEPAPVATGPQLAWVLFWPACALALFWWRNRFGYLLRHRSTTPVRAVDLVAATSGVALVVTGLHLAAVGAVRGIAHLVSNEYLPVWNWAIDPGPLDWLATEPQWQLVAAAVAIVVGVIDLRLGRRRPRRRPSTPIGQAAAGSPSPARLGPGFGPLVRTVAKVGLVLAVVDILAVIAVMVFGELPSSGLWRDDTVVGHLVFVVVLAAALFRFASHADYGGTLHTLTGAVLVGGLREPFVWLSGRSSDEDPVSMALPWESLEQVHLIRVLGTQHATAAMFTIRHPGRKNASEYPKELSVSGEQVDALRSLLPAEMITEHTRAPSAG